MTPYAIDIVHSEIGFSVRHMVFAKVRGHFTKWSVDLAYDPADPTRSTLTASIDAASIDTREPQRDGHLRSADFLDADKYPKITFASRKVERVGDKKYKVTGDLTIRDVKREVSLDVDELGLGKDPWGNSRVGYSAKAAINRGDFGLKWNQALETGGVLVGDKVEIEIEAQVVSAPPKAA